MPGNDAALLSPTTDHLHHFSHNCQETTTIVESSRADSPQASSDEQKTDFRADLNALQTFLTCLSTVTPFSKPLNSNTSSTSKSENTNAADLNNCNLWKQLFQTNMEFAHDFDEMAKMNNNNNNALGEERPSSTTEKRQTPSPTKSSKGVKVVASGHFPRPLDLTQPAKSWWRYFEKQIATNTAMCLTCGQTFNRGPKQSTTSLSHHLKMYHRELFIIVQKAKDEELRECEALGNPELGSQSLSPGGGLISNDDFSDPKKLNFVLISAVKEFPEIYNSKTSRASVENNETASLYDVWNSVALMVGNGITGDQAKKKWLQLRDRYRKELKFAIRDNFEYLPKWPYFKAMTWLNEYILGPEENKMITTAQLHFEEKAALKQHGTQNDNGELSLKQENMDWMGNDSNISASNFFTNTSSPAEASVSPNFLLNNLLQAACSNGSAQSSCHESTDKSDNNDCLKDNHNIKQEVQMELFDTALEQIIQSTSSPADLLCAEKFANQELNTKSEKPNGSCIISNRKASLVMPKPDQPSSFNWLKDEDMQFGRIVALRLKNLDDQKKFAIKVAIEQLFDAQEKD